MTVSTAAGKVLTGSGPQSLFGSFLVIQKGTRPAGRNPPIKLRKNYNSSSTQKVTAMATTPKLATASQ